MQFANRFVPAVSGANRTLVMLHGTGGDETSLLELGPILDSAANMLGIRGRSREEGANRFFRRFGEGQFDEADIIAQTHGLAEFIADARSIHELSGDMTLVGYSNGANMAAALMLLHPAVADSAILFRAMLPLLPPTPPELKGKRVFLSSGDRDPMAPIESASRLADALRQYGAQVEHDIAPVGHGLGRGDILAAAKWLNG